MEEDDDVVILESNVHEVATLRRHNRLLMTLCGIAVYPEVVRAAICVQTSVRSWWARREASRRRRARLAVRSAFRDVVAYATHRRVHRAIVALQSHARGYLLRHKTILGRAVTRAIMYSRDVVEYEVALLRMSFARGQHDVF